MSKTVRNVNDTNKLLEDLKESHEKLDSKSEPEVVAIFYYTLRDENGGQSHRTTSGVATYNTSVLNVIKEEFAKSSAIVNNPK